MSSQRGGINVGVKGSIVAAATLTGRRRFGDWGPVPIPGPDGAGTPTTSATHAVARGDR